MWMNGLNSGWYSGSELSGLTFNALSVILYGALRRITFSVIPSNFASRSYPSHTPTEISIIQTPLLDIGWRSYVKLSIVIVHESSLEGLFFFLL